ncbi:hypothetical protein HZC07_02775 [Candidatus Micrarchaeota archaeon]|nr:hypothetical protein [Candidatus Micrarchaeota archaeon]
MNKKGFLFVVTVFLILTYILLSISIWVKGVETSERAYSEFYKESTLELAIDQITTQKIDNVSNIILNRGLFRLNEEAIDSELKAGPTNDENRYIRNSLYELLENGSVNASNFRIGTGILPEPNSSIRGWIGNLNSSLLAIGVYVSDFNVTNFSVGQNDNDRINYSFNLGLQLKDYSNTSSISRRYYINNSLSISGLVDPALARESKRRLTNQTIYRQFFFYKTGYTQTGTGTIGVRKMGTPVNSGQGWIYGALATALQSNDQNLAYAPQIPPEQRAFYILVGNFSDIIAIPTYDQFGGYIVTDAPGNPSNCSASQNNENNTFNPIKYRGAQCGSAVVDCTEGACTTTPFTVIPRFNPSSAPRCPINPTNSFGRCVLLLNNASVEVADTNKLAKRQTTGSDLYDVENIRDFVMCGYYGPNPSAPSYLQHLMEGTYSRNSSIYGIETFVIGEYSNSSTLNARSRLDRELFNSSITGVPVRGLPGCRSNEVCLDSPTTGIFTISPQAIAAYGLREIACLSGRCDQ